MKKEVSNAKLVQVGIVALLVLVPATCLVGAVPLKPDLEQAVALLEELSAEGVNVDTYVNKLNRALELYMMNRTDEADAIVVELLAQLQQEHAQLPRYRLVKWVNIGLQIAVLAAIPPLFYYFFQRIYALAWAHARRKWNARMKHDNRR